MIFNNKCLYSVVVLIRVDVFYAKGTLGKHVSLSILSRHSSKQWIHTKSHLLITHASRANSLTYFLLTTYRHRCTWKGCIYLTRLKCGLQSVCRNSRKHNMTDSVVQIHCHIGLLIETDSGNTTMRHWTNIISGPWLTFNYAQKMG